LDRRRSSSCRPLFSVVAVHFFSCCCYYPSN
jgi:hypothetical protein